MRATHAINNIYKLTSFLNLYKISYTCRPIVWVRRQLVAYMAIFGTQFLSLKLCNR